MQNNCFVTLEQVINCNDDPLLKIASAVVLQAVNDYCKSLRLIKSVNYDIEKIFNSSCYAVSVFKYKTDCEVFFKSKWYAELVTDPILDGENIIRILREQLDFDNQSFILNMNKYREKMLGV